MKKRIIAVVILLVTGLCACGIHEGNIEKSNENAMDSVIQNTEVAEEPYSMMFYTEEPNSNSSIKIEYPYFTGNHFDTVNALIYGKVQNLAQIDTSFFPADAGLTLDYKSAVTLLNSKAVSIIFWGETSMEGGAYPTDNLITFNIDLETMEEITFEDLYTVNTDFVNIFFERAVFPVNPVTSYDETNFGEMLKLQTPEYQSVDPFSIPGNVSCFLKPDGIVLSMPAVHATGNDHFEAQLKYDDIQQFYLPQDKYWESEPGKGNQMKPVSPKTQADHVLSSGEPADKDVSGGETVDDSNMPVDLAQTLEAEESESYNTQASEEDLSADAQEIKGIAERFAAAYFNGDMDTVQSCLTTPYEWDTEVYAGTETISDFTLKGLKNIGKEEAGSSKVISLEYKNQEQEDSFQYLTLEFVKQETGWKIQFYGIE